MTEKRGSRGGVYDPTLSVRTPTTVRRALEAYASSHDITLSMALSAILEVWLRMHGWMDGSGQKPTGPRSFLIASSIASTTSAAGDVDELEGLSAWIAKASE